LHIVDVHKILCEDDFLSCAGIRHLIYGDKVDRKLGNMQHIPEASIGEFNPSFISDIEKRLSPIRIGGNFHASKEEYTSFEAGM
jgi:hypothetical protein